jgi:hypothetical protein
MSPIRVTRLLLNSITRDGRGALALNFRPRRRLCFTAGQHGLWIVPGGGVAPFTVASAPEEELVTLGTSVASQTRLKRALAALTAGDMGREGRRWPRCSRPGLWSARWSATRLLPPHSR